MRIFGTKRPKSPSSEMYASSADFCRVFEDQMDRLYLLSLLLTADLELARKCFVRGLEDSKNGSPVFKEWAESWARRTVITNAIRMIGPRPGISSPVTRSSLAEGIQGLPEKLAAIIDLPKFERFVFVMSVLEGYAARDCRLLLNCSNFDVAQARAQALQQLARSTEAAESAEALAKTYLEVSRHDAESADSSLRQGQLTHLAATA
jgi:DNA-directed RNA polymerase specialized sigma24 family protein